MSLVLGNAGCAVAIVDVVPSISQRAMRSVALRYCRPSAVAVAHMLRTFMSLSLREVLSQVGSLSLCAPAHRAGMAASSARIASTLIASCPKGAIQMWLRGRILQTLLTVLPRPS